MARKREGRDLKSIEDLVGLAGGEGSPENSGLARPTGEASEELLRKREEYERLKEEFDARRGLLPHYQLLVQSYTFNQSRGGQPTPHYQLEEDPENEITQAQKYLLEKDWFFDEEGKKKPLTVLYMRGGGVVQIEEASPTRTDLVFQKYYKSEKFLKEQYRRHQKALLETALLAAELAGKEGWLAEEEEEFLAKVEGFCKEAANPESKLYACFLPDQWTELQDAAARLRGRKKAWRESLTPYEGSGARGENAEGPVQQELFPRKAYSPYPD